MFLLNKNVMYNIKFPNLELVSICSALFCCFSSFHDSLRKLEAKELLSICLVPYLRATQLSTVQISSFTFQLQVPMWRSCCSQA